MKNEKKWRTCAIVIVTVVVLVLLTVGVPLVILGIGSINESRSIPTGDDASVALIYGLLAAAVGSFMCLVAAIVSLVFLGAAFVSWLSKPHRNKK